MKKTFWSTLVAGLMAMGSMSFAQDAAPPAPAAEAGASAALQDDRGPDQAGLNDRRENPREDRRDDRREARREDQGASRQGGSAQANANYKFHNGFWWYQTADGWLYWQNGRWNRYQSGAAVTTRNYGYSQPRYSQPYYGGGYYNQPYSSGYRGYYDGYNDSGYYGRGYGYGRGGYGYNYNGPGYGNRGWGNMNYGNRGANQGSNIGGMIDQGLGGSGRAGAAIGGAIGR